MNSTDLRALLGNFRKYKLLPVLNIAGLGTGLAIAILIFNYAFHEFQADKYHENLEDIYMLENNGRHHVAFEMAQLLEDQVPGIKHVSMVWSGLNKDFVLLNEEGISVQSDVIFADDNFSSIFSFGLLKGSLKDALSEPGSVILTESEARVLFGDTDPIGKVITIKGKVIYLGESPLEVKAVIRDFPDNSNIQFSAAVSFISASRMMSWLDDCGWGCNNVQNYVQVEKGQDPITLASLMTSQLSPLIPEEVDCELSLFPYKKVFFSSIRDHFKHGNLKLLYTLISIAVLILLIACINYINLSMAGSSNRLTEVGLKKIVGVEPTQLIRQFLSESILISTLALLLAVTLAWFITPPINRLSVISLPDLAVTSPFFWLLATCAGIFIGLLAGVIPALALSKFQPIALLSGKTKGHFRGINLKRALIVFQFVISIALIVCTLTVTRQLRYVRNLDMGFNSENVINLKLSPEVNHSTLKDELSQIPGVEGISFSRWYPGNIQETWGMELVNDGVEEKVWFAAEHADAAYLDLMELEIVAGREFTDRPSDYHAMVLNEAAVKEFGLENPLEAYFQKGDEIHRIVGVIKDFNFRSLHSQIGPLAIMEQHENFFSVNIKLAGGDFQFVQRTLDQIKSSWKKVSPSFPFEFVFIDDQVESLYRNEIIFQKIFRYGSIFAIFISCLGLFGLVLSSTEQRRKEIGIRRVNGAGIGNLILMLNKDFIKWVLVAFVFASPASWFLMKNWLENFSYRIPLSWWIFVIAGMLALVIALITVSWQSWKTATRNPVEALRYE